MKREQRRLALKRIYAKVPVVKCQGKCSAYCGPIAMNEDEMRRLTLLHGSPPGIRQDFSCEILTADGRCSQYLDRPLICRLWGAAEGMECPYGCEVEGDLLTREQANVLIQATAELADVVWTSPEAEMALTAAATQDLDLLKMLRSRDSSS